MNVTDTNDDDCSATGQNGTGCSDNDYPDSGIVAAITSWVRYLYNVFISDAVVIHNNTDNLHGHQEVVVAQPKAILYKDNLHGPLCANNIF